MNPEDTMIRVHRYDLGESHAIMLTGRLAVDWQAMRPGDILPVVVPAERIVIEVVRLAGDTHSAVRLCPMADDWDDDTSWRSRGAFTRRDYFDELERAESIIFA